MKDFNDFWDWVDEEEYEKPKVEGDFWIVKKMDDNIYFTKKIYRNEEPVYQVLEIDYKNKICFSKRYQIRTQFILPIQKRQKTLIIENKLPINIITPINKLKHILLDDVYKLLNINDIKIL